MIGAGRARERDGEALHALLRYDSPESLCTVRCPMSGRAWRVARQ